MELGEQEEEMAMESESYDSLEMPDSGGPGESLSAQLVMNNNFIHCTDTNKNKNKNKNNGNHNNNRSSSNNPRYRECLKNHAVGVGGHALDGCGEFMSAGAEGTLDALKCAACNCHRNFHRKETDTGSVVGVGFGIRPTDPYWVTNHPPQFAPYYRTPAGYLHVGGRQRSEMLALPSTSGGGGGGTQSKRELGQEDVVNPSSGSGSKKRFRTKFSQEQKEKLLDLAEKLGWRIQKDDEALIQQFCNDYGVKRHVLKVWMHNNKHSLGKKP